MQHKNLKGENTLGLSSESPVFFEIKTDVDLQIVIEQVASQKLLRPFYFLGGGSNLILSEKLSRPVLKMSLQGKKILAESTDAVRLQVAGGENWNQFVRWSVSQKFYGLENLVLIPGTVGAAPIQNIGAYGAEAKDFIESVRGYDFKSQQWMELKNSECHFSYRDSVFKKIDMSEFLITEVVFLLKKQSSLVNLSYKELALSLESKHRKATPENILCTVEELRRSKLPDPVVIGNAGSFFKNPLVTCEKAKVLKESFPQLPVYIHGNDLCKLSAGWMIEQCGWKGRRQGPVGMYEKQALVLINDGEGTCADVLALADAVQRDVFEKFQVQLEIEPLVWK